MRAVKVNQAVAASRLRMIQVRATAVRAALLGLLELWPAYGVNAAGAMRTPCPGLSFGVAEVAGVAGGVSGVGRGGGVGHAVVAEHVEAHLSVVFLREFVERAQVPGELVESRIDLGPAGAVLVHDRVRLA